MNIYSGKNEGKYRIVLLNNVKNIEKDIIIIHLICDSKRATDIGRKFQVALDRPLAPFAIIRNGVISYRGSWKRYMSHDKIYLYYKKYQNYYDNDSD